MDEDLCEIVNIATNPGFRRRRFPYDCSYENERAKLGEGVFPVMLLIRLDDFKAKESLEDLSKYKEIIVCGIGGLCASEVEVISEMLSGEVYGGCSGREKYIKVRNC